MAETIVGCYNVHHNQLDCRKAGIPVDQMCAVCRAVVEAEKLVKPRMVRVPVELVPLLAEVEDYLTAPYYSEEATTRLHDRVRHIRLQVEQAQVIAGSLGPDAPKEQRTCIYCKQVFHSVGDRILHEMQEGAR